MGKLRKRLIAGLAAVGITTVSALAFAVVGGYTDGQLSLVEVGPSFLLLQIPAAPEVNFVAQGTSPCSGIPATDADTMKSFISLGQAAVLSQRHVRLYWSKCTSTGAPYITGMDVDNY